MNSVNEWLHDQGARHKLYTSGQEQDDTELLKLHIEKALLHLGLALRYTDPLSCEHEYLKRSADKASFAFCEVVDPFVPEEE
jgi:hypothetical protein